MQAIWRKWKNDVLALACLTGLLVWAKLVFYMTAIVILFLIFHVQIVIV